MEKISIFFLKKSQIEKFLQNGATAPREERAASCHEGGQSDREGGEYAFVGMMTLMLMMMAMAMLMMLAMMMMMKNHQVLVGSHPSYPLPPTPTMKKAR